MRINDEDRRQWVLNYEPLYNMWQAWKAREVACGCTGSLTQFVREHRVEIKEAIEAETNKKPL